MRTANMILGTIIVAALVCAGGAEYALPVKDGYECGPQLINDPKHPEEFNNFFANVVELLADIQQNTITTPEASYRYYASHPSFGSPVAYGEAICEPFMPPRECVQCLQDVSAQIWQDCGHPMGARVKKGRCFLRFERYAFR